MGLPQRRTCFCKNESGGQLISGGTGYSSQDCGGKLSPTEEEPLTNPGLGEGQWQPYSIRRSGRLSKLPLRYSVKERILEPRFRCPFPHNS